jgi:hypothetical protein
MQKKRELQHLYNNLMKQAIKRSKKEEQGLMLGELKHDNTKTWG